MLISEFTNNRNVKRFLKLLSLTMIFTIVMMASGVNDVLAAQQEAARSKTAVYEQMTVAYNNYVNLLKEGKENSPEGSVAFNNYVNLKTEYEALSGSSASGNAAIEAASNSSYADVAAGITAKGQSLFEKLLAKFKTEVLPGGSQKQMSLMEKIAWGLGKSIIPTAVVLAFAAFAPLSLGFMIAGSMLIAAVSSGVLTYLYETRSNSFREKKKSGMEILRDVSISAVSDGIMAPFTMATAGLASTFGKVSFKVILQNAIKGAGIQFAGQAISAGAGGLVKHEWAKNYFHYEEKIQLLQVEAGQIISSHAVPGSPELTQQEKDRLAAISQEIADMKAQDYNVDDFHKDIQRAALSAAISGVVGTTATAMAANSRAANLASIKLFGNTSRAGSIANWVASNPVAFLQGTSRAQLEKHYLAQDIKEATAERNKFIPGTTVYNYYNNEVVRLQAKSDSINPLKSGLESAVVNFAVQSVSMGVAIGKEKIIDKPKRDNAAIQERYMESNNQWQKAAESRQKINEFKQENQPKPENYTDVAKYLKDKSAFNKTVDKMEREASKIELKALDAQSLPENKKMLEEVKQQYYKEQQLDRNLEYSRILGQDKYLSAFKEKMKVQNETFKNMSDADLTAAAKTEISRQNQLALDKSKKELEIIDQKLDAGRYVKGKDGKNAEAPEALREYIEGGRELTSKEMRTIEFQAAKISPSAYKAKLVNVKIDEMRVNGATDSQIVNASDKIYAEAEKQMLERYGNNWGTVMYSEFASRQLSNLKYDDEGKMSLWEQLKKLVGKAPVQAESEFVDHYRTEVNSAIKDQLMPQDGVVSAADGDLGALFINTSASTLFDKVVLDEGSSRLFDTTYKGVKTTVTKPISNINQNVVTPSEMTIIMQNRSKATESGRIK
ncbi:MAG TPA: hypothetical protein PKK26_00710 [Candidatus Wallbacteria bacterium]|nr:hypothetical protein [Candidatus Wallbacteria bacterium]